jgi:hypothetical protein
MNLLCKQICQCCRILWFCVHNKQSNFTEAYGYPSMSSTGRIFTADADLQVQCYIYIYIYIYRMDSGEAIVFHYYVQGQESIFPLTLLCTTWLVSIISLLIMNLFQIGLLFSLPVHTNLLTCETGYWSIFIYVYMTGCVKFHVYYPLKSRSWFERDINTWCVNHLIWFQPYLSC